MYRYFPGSEIEGETQDQSLKKHKAFDELSFELGGENSVDIGSMSRGGGAGKARFKDFQSANELILLRASYGRHSVLASILTKQFWKSTLQSEIEKLQPCS